MAGKAKARRAQREEELKLDLKERALSWFQANIRRRRELGETVVKPEISLREVPLEELSPEEAYKARRERRLAAKRGDA